jgi:putative tricarboxylic transport membrane protein
MNRLDKVSSFAWLMASVAIIAGSSVYSLGTLSRPGPAFLPLGCGIIMAVLSLVVFGQAVLRDKGRASKNEEDSVLTTRWPRLVAALAILFAYAFLLEFFGYPMMTLAFMLFVLKVVEPADWWTAILEAVLATGVSYFLFEFWLKVPLPKGIWLDLF